MNSRRKLIESNLRETLEELEGASRLIAVSKTYPAQDIALAYAAGQRDFGENKVQELSEKALGLADTCPEICWHFIGGLQTNKINALLKAPNLASIHSVDSLRLLNKLLSKETSKNIGVFLQFNCSGEAQKGGFEDYKELVEAANAFKAGKGFYLQGLMTMGPIRTEDFEADAKRSFDMLREIRDKLKIETGETHLQLSMGMSQDYPIALEAGADWVRIGTKIFGAREY